MADLKRWSRDEISRMRREMDRLFDELCSDFDLPVMVCRMAGETSACGEEDDILVVRLELGNMNPDNVNVSVRERRRWVISAESARETPSRTPVAHLPQGASAALRHRPLRGEGGIQRRYP